VIRFSGRFRSALIIGGQGIRARKLRTFLSMLSLFLGVLAVVTVQAGSEIAKRALLADIELQQGIDGTLQIYLPQSDAAVPVVLDTLRGQRDGVASVSLQAIIGEPGVTPVNPGASPFDQPGMSRYGDGNSHLECDQTGSCTVVADEATATPPGQAIAVSMTALTGDIRTFRPFREVSGRWLDFTAAPSMSPGIVLNKEAAKGFARYRVPAELRIEGATANATPRIIGVIDDGRASRRRTYARTRRSTGCQRTSSRRLRRRHAGAAVPGGTRSRSDPADPADRVERARQPDPLERIDAPESRVAARTLMRWVFSAWRPRAADRGGRRAQRRPRHRRRADREFALRRAVGTSRMLLAGIVLAETLLTGLFTASAAIGFGALGLSAMSRIFQGHERYLDHLTFPWQAGVAGVLAGLIAGLLGGLIPALRAARIPIATVMRA
jgi:putative ABC transport system permease protein